MSDAYEIAQMNEAERAALEEMERMAAEGTFRADLYYRLSVMSMELPPLRSYKEGNLEVLANVFLQQCSLWLSLA